MLWNVYDDILNDITMLQTIYLNGIYLTIIET